MEWKIWHFANEELNYWEMLRLWTISATITRSSCQIKQSYCSFSCSFLSPHCPIPCFSTNVCCVVVHWFEELIQQKDEAFPSELFFICISFLLYFTSLPCECPWKCKEKSEFSTWSLWDGEGTKLLVSKSVLAYASSKGSNCSAALELEFFSEYLGFAHTGSFWDSYEFFLPPVLQLKALTSHCLNFFFPTHFNL